MDAAEKNHPPTLGYLLLEAYKYFLRSKEELDRPSIVDDSLELWLSVALFSYYIKQKKLHCTYYSEDEYFRKKEEDGLTFSYVCTRDN